MANKSLIKRAALAGVAVVVLAGAADYGVSWWRHGRFMEATDDAYLQADSTIVAPRVSGYIAKVLVADNQHVNAGQVLAELDPRDLQTALAQARATADAASLAITNLDAQITLQKTIIQQSAADLRSAQAALTFAHDNDARYAALARTGAGTQQSAQQAGAALIEATAMVQHQQAAQIAAAQRIAVLTTARQRAAAELQHDQAVAHQAALNLSYATITAPIAGTVGARSLRVGQYVQAGTQLMALVPLHRVYVLANFKETQLTHVRPGQAVDVSVDTFPGTVLHGTVNSLAPASGLEFALLPPDNATGNFTKIVQRIPVKIALDPNTKLLGRLVPGMSVEASIDTQSQGQGASSHIADAR
ncbi:MAG: HlyD family secretion protein [Rhodospirillales bacterium]|nr:HlyD family secretion protein [Rhodospirillales bacterium]